MQKETKELQANYKEIEENVPMLSPEKNGHQSAEKALEVITRLFANHTIIKNRKLNFVEGPETLPPPQFGGIPVVFHAPRSSFMLFWNFYFLIGVLEQILFKLLLLIAVIVRSINLNVYAKFLKTGNGKTIFCFFFHCSKKKKKFLLIKYFFKMGKKSLSSLRFKIHR